jgi:hypothetical protein
MEYLLGSLTTMFGIAILYIAYQSFNYKSRTIKVVSSQSRTFEMLSSSVIMIPSKRTNRITQALKHFESIKVRILMTGTKAYWIKDNSVYVADMQDGNILNETTKIVDMMAIDKVQLDEMIFIIEKLTEGQLNDRWDSGNQEF